MKYKKCHLNRSAEKRVEWWVTAEAYRDAYSRPTCLAPQSGCSPCGGKVIRAHTVPKSASLEAIARGGHVYAFVPSIENLKKNSGRLVPQLLGINRASTFSGFCQRHDDEVFARVEKHPFTADKEQCFLLAYRALARECYTKEAAAALEPIRRQADRGRSLEDQLEIQSFNYLFGTGVRAGVRDNQLYKQEMDQMLVERKFDALCTYVIGLKEPPPVMCSGAFFPEEDFEGAILQKVGEMERTPDLLCVTSFASDGRGYVIFSWLAAHNLACQKFVGSLSRVPDGELTAALVRLFFEHFENIHIQPYWWEKLDENTRQALVQRMSDSCNPFLARPTGRMLVPDGLCFPPWAVIERRSVGCARKLGSE